MKTRNKKKIPRKIVHKHFRQDSDGTIVAANGKILMFGIERFRNEIAFKGSCFICGVAPGVKPFNDEHILPDWILREFTLHSRKITLPNLSSFSYGEYKIPCCVDCNSFMGEHFEKPISEAISEGFEAVVALFKEKGADYVFNWLALIFMKTHLKDTSLRVERDRRKNDDRTIGETFYELETLHHTHCISRSFHTQAIWGDFVRGSLAIGPAKIMKGIESFDFLDNYPAKSILLRMNDVFMIAVMNDGQAAMAHMGPKYLSKMTDGLNILQLRELFARFSHCALSLETRPTFHSGFDPQARYQITARHPKSKTFRDFDGRQFGYMMWSMCAPILEAAGGVSEIDKNNILEGNVSYILDENGKFKTDSLIVNG